MIHTKIKESKNALIFCDNCLQKSPTVYCVISCVMG